MRHCSRAGVGAALLAATVLATACAPAAAPSAPASAAPVSQAAEPAAAGLEAQARALIESMAAGQWAEVTARFDARMAELATPTALQAIWDQLRGQYGAFQGTGAVETRDAAGYQLAVVRTRFERGTLGLQVAYDAEGRVAGFTLAEAPAPAPLSQAPPPGADTTRITEREATVGTGALALPATLSLPRGAGPFPGVVLVHGSGPADRDATLGPNRPFRDLAWQLASRGVAVLRYDKRSRVHPAQLAGPITVRDEVVDDAVAALHALRRAPGVDADRVFLLGHSLGGMLVPRIGTRDPRVAGFIVLAGATRPLPETILGQMRYLSELDGAVTASDSAQLRELEAAVSRIAALGPADARSAEPILGVPASYWWDLRGYDPPRAARALQRPLLILQGGRDYQVTEEDFARWRAALGERAQYRMYPELNHLFIPGEGRPGPAEYQRPGHVAPRVADDIANFIRGTGN